MPIGYLITVAVPALLTATLLVPVPHTWTLGQLCWRLGFQLNELPVLVVVWVLAATTLAAAQGDLGNPLGVVAVTVAVLTLVGLGVVLWRGLQAGPIVVRALSDGLGSGWRH